MRNLQANGKAINFHAINAKQKEITSRVVSNAQNAIITYVRNVIPLREDIQVCICFAKTIMLLLMKQS